MKKKIKKTHIPVILASVLLILLIGALIYVIFFMKDTNKKTYGEKPTNKTLNIGYDTKGDVYKSLKSISYKDVKVSYSVNNDLVEKDIDLEGNVSKVIYDDNVLVYSESYTNRPYIIVLNKDGETIWMKILDTKKYNKLKLLSVFEKKKNFYAIGYYENGKTYSIVVFKYDSTGKLLKTEVVKEKLTFTTIAADNYDNGFAVYTTENSFLNILAVNTELKIENNLSIADFDARFKSGLIYVENMNAYNNKMYLSVIHTIPGVSSNKYLFTINLDNATASFKGIDNIEAEYTKIINDKYVGFSRQKINIYSFEGELQKTIDYTKLEILEDKLIDTKNDTETEYDAIMDIIGIYEYNDKIIVNISDYNTEAYDVFDKDYNLVSRYVFTYLFEADKDGYTICVIPSNDLYMLKTNLASSGAITAFKANIGGK